MRFSCFTPRQADGAILRRDGLRGSPDPPPFRRWSQTRDCRLAWGGPTDHRGLVAPRYRKAEPVRVYRSGPRWTRTRTAELDRGQSGIAEKAGASVCSRTFPEELRIDVVLRSLHSQGTTEHRGLSVSANADSDPPHADADIRSRRCRAVAVSADPGGVVGPGASAPLDPVPRSRLAAGPF